MFDFISGDKIKDKIKEETIDLDLIISMCYFWLYQK